MHIMTKDGWKLLHRPATPETHVPTILEAMGIDLNYSGLKAMADYANAFGNGCYFTYKADGTSYQSKPAIHPLPGMF